MRTFITAIAAGMLISGAATAQDFYGGVALDYHKPHAGEEHSAAALIAGIQLGRGTISYGLEADASTPVDGTDTYDALRVRGLAFYDLGGVEALAGIGATQYTLNGDSFTGYNFGLGAQIPWNDSWSVRVEFIRDMMDQDYTTNVTTTRLGMIYRF